MSNLQWFRLYHRIIDDEKIRLLAFEDRWHFIALCCLKADGLLDEPDSAVKWRKIAVKMGVQTRELDEVRRRLQEVDLIDENMVPLAWDALQYTAERKQQERHRERREEAGLPRRRWVNPGVRARVYERDGHSCVYCGSAENLTLDHVVSELKGGSNDETNLVTACRQCNARKREFTIEQAAMSYRPGYTPPAKQGPSKALASTDTETDTETEVAAAARASEKSDFDALSEKLLDAVGDGNIQPHGALVLGPIIGLIEAGCDLETDILPTIRARAARLKRPAGSWQYFVEAIRDAYSQRIEAGRGLVKSSSSGKQFATVADVFIDKDSKLSPEELRREWIKRLEFCRRNRTWNTDMMGAPPGKEGCRVPEEFLTDHDRSFDWDIEFYRGAA